MLILIVSLALNARAAEDLHVYRHALGPLATEVAPNSLPSHYLVERKFPEGVARLRAGRWYAASGDWRLEFEGAIGGRLPSSRWRVRGLFALDTDGRRRVFMELVTRISAVGPRRFSLVEIRFAGPSRVKAQVDRLTLVPLRFDVDRLNEGPYEYRRRVTGPEWAKRNVYEVDNQGSPERLVRLMGPGSGQSLHLTPADDVGHGRLHRFILANRVTLDVPEGTTCVRQLRIVR